MDEKRSMWHIYVNPLDAYATKIKLISVRCVRVRAGTCVMPALAASTSSMINAERAHLI